MQDVLVQVAVVGVGVVACVTDLRTRRIPNALTFGAALVGLAYHGATPGGAGLLHAGAGWLVGVLFFAPFFLLGGMGAGDVKLVGALGAWLGPLAAIWLGLFTGIAGGVLGLIVALKTGYLRQAMSNIWMLLTFWRVSGLKPLPELTLEGGRGPKLAFAVPITAGALVTLWLK